jgi:acyl-CoA synthetase (AMP-forming)/AMP-acid ligase II
VQIHVLSPVTCHLSQVTTLNLVPPIVAFLVKSPLVDEYDLTSLRAGYSSAAPLAPDMEPRIKSRLKLDIFNQGSYYSLFITTFFFSNVFSGNV